MKKPRRKGLAEFIHKGHRYRAWWEAEDCVSVERGAHDGATWIHVAMPGDALLAAARTALGVTA